MSKYLFDVAAAVGSVPKAKQKCFSGRDLSTSGKFSLEEVVVGLRPGRHRCGFGREPLRRGGAGSRLRIFWETWFGQTAAPLLTSLVAKPIIFCNRLEIISLQDFSMLASELSNMVTQEEDDVVVILRDVLKLKIGR